MAIWQGDVFFRRIMELTIKDLNSKFKYAIKNTAENQYDFNKQLSLLCEKF